MAVQPQGIVWHEASGQLELQWDDGVQAWLGSRELREACKCAACENTRRAGRPFVAAEATALTQLHPIGEFGLQLIFNDGHDRGIYPWPYLHALSLHALSLRSPA
ncbi:MAG: DUF971 domain-containing protein [Rhizobacter sp.]|nr:DUF971 domain-containing protein [Rhizobacter sp.]